MFVYKLEDKYLIYSEGYGHTGTKVFINWTEDINKASVFSWEDAKLRRRVQELGAVRVLVSVLRIVTEM